MSTRKKRIQNQKILLKYKQKMYRKENPHLCFCKSNKIDTHSPKGQTDTEKIYECEICGKEVRFDLHWLSKVGDQFFL